MSLTRQKSILTREDFLDCSPRALIVRILRFLNQIVAPLLDFVETIEQFLLIVAAFENSGSSFSACEEFEKIFQSDSLLRACS